MKSKEQITELIESLNKQLKNIKSEMEELQKIKYSVDWAKKYGKLIKQGDMILVKINILKWVISD